MTIIQFRRTIARDSYARSVICNLFVKESWGTLNFEYHSFLGFEFIDNKLRISTVNIGHATSIHIVDHQKTSCLVEDTP